MSKIKTLIIATAFTLGSLGVGIPLFSGGVETVAAGKSGTICAAQKDGEFIGCLSSWGYCIFYPNGTRVCRAFKI